jgi:hypothetical protein
MTLTYNYTPILKDVVARFSASPCVLLLCDASNLIKFPVC